VVVHWVHLPHYPNVECLSLAAMAGIGGEKMVKKRMLIFPSGGNTVLEHLPHYPKVEC
jgi:hypothetical protein